MSKQTSPKAGLIVQGHARRGAKEIVKSYPEAAKALNSLGDAINALSRNSETFSRDMLAARMDANESILATARKAIASKAKNSPLVATRKKIAARKKKRVKRAVSSKRPALKRRKRSKKS